jgi:hypothetical protein
MHYFGDFSIVRPFRPSARVGESADGFASRISSGLDAGNQFAGFLLWAHEPLTCYQMSS